jgi:hypothetical protein
MPTAFRRMVAASQLACEDHLLQQSLRFTGAIRDALPLHVPRRDRALDGQHLKDRFRRFGPGVGAGAPLLRAPRLQPLGS